MFVTMRDLVPLDSVSFGWGGNTDLSEKAFTHSRDLKDAAAALCRYIQESPTSVEWGKVWGGGRELNRWSLNVVLQAAVGCAGLLRVRVAAKKVPGVRFSLFSPTAPAT